MENDTLTRGSASGSAQGQGSRVIEKVPHQLTNKDTDDKGNCVVSSLQKYTSERMRSMVPELIARATLKAHFRDHKAVAADKWDGRNHTGKTKGNFDQFIDDIGKNGRPFTGLAVSMLADKFRIPIIALQDQCVPKVWGKSHYDSKVHPMLVKIAKTTDTTSDTAEHYHMTYWEGKLKPKQLAELLVTAAEAPVMNCVFAGGGSTDDNMTLCSARQKASLSKLKEKFLKKEKDRESEKVKSETKAKEARTMVQKRKMWKTKKGRSLSKINFASTKAVFKGADRCDDVLRRNTDNLWLDPKRGKEAMETYRAVCLDKKKDGIGNKSCMDIKREATYRKRGSGSYDMMVWHCDLCASGLCLLRAALAACEKGKANIPCEHPPMGHLHVAAATLLEISSVSRILRLLASKCPALHSGPCTLLQ